MESYLTDINLNIYYEFHLYDVVCKQCRMCNSGSHDWKNIPHKKECILYA